MKTEFFTKGDVERKWYEIDAAGKRLGRVATEVAKLILGKHKPEWTPQADVGDFVIVTNSDEIEVTGEKKQQKMYQQHTGYPGNVKEITLEDQLDKDSTEVIRRAVYGMLPKNKLRDDRIQKLKVYQGPDHPHEAQQPEELEIE